MAHATNFNRELCFLAPLWNVGTGPLPGTMPPFLGSAQERTLGHSATLTARRGSKGCPGYGRVIPPSDQTCVSKARVGMKVRTEIVSVLSRMQISHSFPAQFHLFGILFSIHLKKAKSGAVEFRAFG
jgi:hypothetical protein